MDLEIRELLRHYKSEPSWNLTYRLLRARQRVDGDIIPLPVLQQFAKVYLVPPFLRAITRINEHNYFHYNEIDFFENLQYAINITDNVEAAHRGFIPEPGEHPFSLTLTLIFPNDTQIMGRELHTRLESTVLGTNIDNVQWSLNSITLEEFRRGLASNFNYDVDYLFNQPWGYQGVLALPKSEWGGGGLQLNLILMYSFYPDQVLWNLLINRTFH